MQLLVQDEDTSIRITATQVDYALVALILQQQIGQTNITIVLPKKVLVLSSKYLCSYTMLQEVE